MRRTQSILLSTLLILALAACSSGDGGGGGEGPGDDTVAGEDTGTVEPGEGDHSFWPGAAWGTIWPTAADGATYSVDAMGTMIEMDAYLEFDQDYEGETWHRGVLGDPQPGAEGMVIWFENSVPWEPTVRAVEVYHPHITDGPSLREYFETPLPLPLDLDIAQSQTVNGTISMDFGGDDIVEMGAEYTLTPVAFDETLDLPMGSLDGCAHFKAEVGGEFMGGDFILEVHLWIHPEQFIVKMTETPGYPLVELKEGWK